MKKPENVEKIRESVGLHCRRGYHDGGMDTRTLEALAVEVGVTSVTIRRFLAGTNKRRPNSRLVEALAKAVSA